MKIHPIQTGLVRVKDFQIHGGRSNIMRIYDMLFTQKWGEWMPIFCWLIETSNEMILIDTGDTSRVHEEGYIPQGTIYDKLVQNKITREDEIDFQLKELGFSCDDISTVILTHLHGDHIGGNEFFPKAQFFVSQKEYDFATSKKGISQGYFTQNWPRWFKPFLINYEYDKLGPFDSSFTLPHQNSIKIVPTPGHSIGHQSVIINSGAGVYFIAGDLSYNIQTLQSGVANTVLNNKEAFQSIRKAQQFVQSTGALFLSSHDWEVKNYLQ